MGIASAIAGTLLLAGCSTGGGGTSPASDYKPGTLTRAYSGTTIDLMLPPWASFKKAELQKFTKQTGIQVKLNTLSWDSIHDKVVTASAAGQAPADVVEMDWTWVSQFGGAGWFADLADYLTPSQISSSVGASTFVSGKHQIAVPYSLDFRGTDVNSTMLEKAGITSPPTTTAEVIADAEAIKKAGIVEYPIGLPLKVLEGTSTPWYALVRSAGGQILTTKGQPAFDKDGSGLKALKFIREAYQKGLIDPGSIGLDDQAVAANFAAGQSAVLLAAGPGGTAGFSDPTKSKIVDDTVTFVHIPGESNATGPTVSLQEGLAIPKASKHREAAAMFITWWLKTPQLIAAYNDPDMGNLPPSRAALSELASQKKLSNADTILSLVDTVQPVIPGGTPTWYSKFSTNVAQTIQAVALGNETPEAGISSLTSQAKKLSAG